MPILKKKLHISKSKFVSKISIYFVLFGIGFVYLYPVIYMVMNSIFSQADLIDPSVTWIPTELYFENYAQAFKVLDFTKSFATSILMSAVPTILQTAITACIGFGLARFKFPMKKMWIVLILATFLLPTQIMMVPRFVLFDRFNITNTVFAQFLPALFGQGIKSAIFILVFFQYFTSYPKTLDEAAGLDGAGKFTIFTKIALPISKGAIVLTILFSFVWYWNETYQSGLMFGSVLQTLPLKLQSFTARYEAIYGSGSGLGGNINESITLAGTFLSIIPLLILYIFLQRQFVESIEQSGITGE